jgi:hypothetical protein
MAIPTMPLSCWQSTVGVVAHVKLHWKQKTGTCSCLSDYLSAQAALGLWQSSRMQPGAEQLQPIGLPIPGPMQRTQSLMLATCFELPAAEAGPATALARLTPQQQRQLQGVALQSQPSRELHVVRAVWSTMIVSQSIARHAYGPRAYVANANAGRGV